MRDNIIKFLICLCFVVGINVRPGYTFALNDEQNSFVNSGQLNAVISDSDFLDKDSLSVQQIQDFFNSYGSYLKDFIDTSESGLNRSAAQIIWDAAHGKYEATGTLNGIVIDETTGTVSPKVLLVYLQKEQSLAQRADYNEWAMLASMGYYCYSGVITDHPTLHDNNNNNCADEFEGFTKQVENGAWQLRYSFERAQGTGFSNYQVGQTMTTSDGYTVLLTNKATSSVYRYTPYVFNSAFNVWNIFYNRYHFGTSPTPTNPTPTPPRKAGDANGDNVIDLLDLSLLADKWGSSDSNCDFDKNGVVDLLDLSILADQWGK